jgi:ribosomal protein S6--L-glutamate ligase
MTRRPRLVVVGYPTRLVADHAVLVEAAEAAGFDTEVVAPGRLALDVVGSTIDVLVDGIPSRPDVVLPRGVNRPWPFVQQVLTTWASQGVAVVPSVQAADLCADKLTTARVLAAADVPVLHTVGVVADEGVDLAALASDGPLVAKPARASKGRGIDEFASAADAETSLAATRPLQAGMVDHRVVQPRASAWGVDYRVVVARDRGPLRVVAVTERQAPAGVLVTNAHGTTVIDVDPEAATHADVVLVAMAAARALQLDFGGIDVIRHHGRAVVLEANTWPGLAAEERGRELADALVATALRRHDAGPAGVATFEPRR